MTNIPLKNTTWLAQRLSISETTIERLRAMGGSDLPPHINVGRSIRYDVAEVEAWIAQRLHTQSQRTGGAP